MLNSKFKPFGFDNKRVISQYVLMIHYILSKILHFQSDIAHRLSNKLHSNFHYTMHFQVLISSTDFFANKAKNVNDDSPIEDLAIPG